MRPPGRNTTSVGSHLHGGAILRATRFGLGRLNRLYVVRIGAKTNLARKIERGMNPEPGALRDWIDQTLKRNASRRGKAGGELEIVAFAGMLAPTKSATLQ